MPGRSSQRSAWLAGLAAVLLGACGPSAPADAVTVRLEPVDHVPAADGALDDCNLLLVTLDTTRADHLGCYGNASIRTPVLDHLAARGVLFADVLAAAPMTLPSHASLMTGLHPARHGARVNGLFRLEDRFETLAERLRDAGFRTGAVVSAFPLASQFGLAQGFEHYDDDLSDGPAPLPGHYRERTADQTTARALAWLRGVRGERFFLWVHYFDPHAGYAPPSPFAERYASAPYDGEIAYVDGALGALLEELGREDLTERTLVAVVGDHGEGLGQHSEPTHAYQVYDSTLRVPLILAAGRRLGGGVVCTRPVSQVDVAPLLLRLLGCAPFDGAQDLLAPVAAVRPRFFESLDGAVEFGWEPLHGVVDGEHKYIHSSSPELYDLAHDRAELDNLVAREPAEAERLRALLFASVPEALAAAPAPTVRPDPAEQAELEALGYSGGGSAPATGAPTVAPQVMMPVLTRVTSAEEGVKSVEQRVAELSAVLAEHPDFLPAWKVLASVYRGAERLDEAATALERCRTLSPGTPQAEYELALVRATQGRDEDALHLLAPVVAAYPDFVEPRYLYGTVLARTRHFAQAVEHLRAVFELAPEHERCLEHLVAACRLAGRRAELVEILQAHLAAHPDAARVRQVLEQL